MNKLQNCNLILIKKIFEESGLTIYYELKQTIKFHW
jgi:hypothetical protein